MPFVRMGGRRTVIGAAQLQLHCAIHDVDQLPTAKGRVDGVRWTGSQITAGGGLVDEASYLARVCSHPDKAIR